MNKNKPTKKDLKFAILAVDAVLFMVRDEQLEVLLMPVNIQPHFSGVHGVPGGLIDSSETADEAAERHLLEKAGVKNMYMEQLYTFSDVERDPRGRVVSVAYIALISQEQAGKIANKKDVEWFPVKKLPELAYDHRKIIQTAIERLSIKLEYTNIVCNLLPDEFTLSELQNIYEIILNKEIDKRNFRKKILSLGMLKEVSGKKVGGANRPAQVYSFKSKKLTTLDIL